MTEPIDGLFLWQQDSSSIIDATSPGTKCVCLMYRLNLNYISSSPPPAARISLDLEDEQ